MGKVNWCRRREVKSQEKKLREEAKVCIGTPGSSDIRGEDSISCRHVGPVSIVREFLNIWDDLKVHFGDTSETAGGGKVGGGDKKKGGNKWSVVRREKYYKARQKSELTIVTSGGQIRSVTAGGEMKDKAGGDGSGLTDDDVFVEADTYRYIHGCVEDNVKEPALVNLKPLVSSSSVAVGPETGATGDMGREESSNTVGEFGECTVEDIHVSDVKSKDLATDDISDEFANIGNNAVSDLDIKDAAAVDLNAEIVNYGKSKVKVTSLKSKSKKKRKFKHKRVQPISVPPNVPSSMKQQGDVVGAMLGRPQEENNCNLKLQQSSEADDASQPGEQGEDCTKKGHDELSLLVCDLNNNQYCPSLSTIIDVGEDDTSSEIVLSTAVVSNKKCHPLNDKTWQIVPATVIIKHPLEHEWTFWYSPYRNRTWEENLKIIKTVATIEDFWAVHNWVEPPSKLMSGADYSLFKAGINPDWDDTSNRKGGRWVVNCGRQGVDKEWMEVIMAMVGQQFGEGQDMLVTGAVVSARNRGDKVAVWVREVAGSDQVGKRMATVVGRDGVFKVHKK